MQITDCMQLELHINNFGGTKLKRNYIWVYANQKRLNAARLKYLQSWKCLEELCKSMRDVCQERQQPPEGSKVIPESEGNKKPEKDTFWPTI
jgi:hypothetical protein